MPSRLRRRSSNPRGESLLAVGPFAGLSAPKVSSLPNSNGAFIVASTNTRTNPYKFKNLTMGVGNYMEIDATNWSSIFVWADVVSMNASSSILANGQNGVDETGGSGGSGGGGGGQFTGGGGGSGDNGNTGTGSPVTSPGFGWGQFVTAGFAWPFGGDGGAATDPSGGTGGDGAPGYGGGGGGNADAFGNVGGGGGGLICIVCRDLSGSGQLYAFGGEAESGVGGGGGGGSIYVAAQKYTGTITAFVNGGPGGAFGGSDGTARIYEIGADGATLTLRAFNQSWDNT